MDLDDAALGPGAVTARRAWMWTLALIGLITAVRVAGLFASPVELYPEEAQYWLWSRHLAFGYFSKPPMIAWAIAATTHFGGGEAWVRLTAPLAHGVAALAMAAAGRRLYDGWTGLWGAVLYSLAPGVQLSSAVIATDCLVMACSALAVLSYAGWLTSEGAEGRLGWAAGLGVSLGLGALAKYAIVYIALGLGLHAVLSPAVRRRWRGREVAVAAGVAVAALSPNLLWNAAHGFQTVAHTAHSADWNEATDTASVRSPKAHASLITARAAPGFLLAQLGVFGPIPFVALVVGAALATRRRRTEAAAPGWSADGALGCLTAPALVLILLESLIARANANWAAVAYVPAALLVAAWLLRWRAGLWLWLTAGSEAAMMAVFLAAAVSPRAADAMHMANSFKRARGWEAVDALAKGAARRLGPSSLSAIAVDDRFTFNALAYYGRDDWPAGAPALTMWVRESRPGNEAETASPLKDGRRVLFVDIGGAYRQEAMRDFIHVRPLGAWKVWTDPRHFRDVFMFLGEDYRRRLRDPRTGLPVPA
ncbi:glycosyltransferase family 39 protein [Caulobacter sp. S45]|uniref:ArnT family glycosyltransferase n=1 Tax=Caulobacter sp. S45 TaxID=1641861 RepID=UPI001576CFE4|nr:glycosyltransferase family 39 protein [Caulobacter sp. S45]